MTERTDDSLTIEGPVGIQATAKGTGPMIALLVCVGFAGMSYLIYAHSQDAKADANELKAQFAEVVYVLSLSEADRAKLNIAMPHSLRSRTRGRHNDE